MRSKLVALALLSIATAPLFAREKSHPKPNTLTPQEIAEGWLLLFDGETTFGWQIDGQAQVRDGVLVLGGKKDTTARVTTEFGFGDFHFQFRLDEHPSRITVSVNAFSQDLNLWHYRKSPVVHWKQAIVTVRPDSLPFLIPTEGQSGLPKGATSRERTALAFHVPAGSKLRLRSVAFKPAGLQPIFNGKDLSGWKEIRTPRTKSRFTVTPEGWLNIRNGPGDLQTEGQWDDFVLQLDCFSNGEHLNSGVFFRCLPGQFWSGYEAQIRNQWQGNDRTRPVDYGTGGIYNRQPARKVVSSDHEWFTMTVIAGGNHLAVWVNGYRTADFTDHRPSAKNARRGSKAGKGPISLQGHDPTTDLSFRRIRIAELPKAASGKQGRP